MHLSGRCPARIYLRPVQTTALVLNASSGVRWSFGKNGAGGQVRPYTRSGGVGVHINSQTASASDIGRRNQRVGEAHRLAALE